MKNAKCRALWRHDASGWEVVHCGHPTANWPYAAVDPAHPDDCAVTHNGLGFRTLLDAMQAVEAVLWGDMLSTTEGCVGICRRLLTQGELDDWRRWCAAAGDPEPSGWQRVLPSFRMG